MSINRLFIQKLVIFSVKSALLIIFLLLSKPIFAQKDVIKIDSTENTSLKAQIDKYIEVANKENTNMNLTILSNSLSTFQTWLSLLAFVFPLISVIAGFVVYFYGRSMNQKKVEAEEKLREIEKLHDEILKIKDDILIKTSEIARLKEIVEYREIKDIMSATFLSRMIDHGFGNREDNDRLQTLITKLDWLQNNNYEESQHDIYIRGVHAYCNRNYDKASIFFSESLRKDPSNFFHIAYDAKANCYYKQKKFDEGYEFSKIILTHLPYDFRALNKLIFYFKLKKDYMNAERIINQLKVSNSSEYIIQKAMLNILQSKPDDQLFVGTSGDAFNTTKGITKLLLGKYSEASEEFKSAIIKMNRLINDTTTGEIESLSYTLAQVNLNMAYCLLKIDYSKHKSTIINLMTEADRIDLKFRDRLGIEMINSNYFLFVTQEEVEYWSELREIVSA